MPYVPTRKERLEELKPYVMPAVAGVIALGVIAWVVWHGLSPRQQGGSTTKDVAARLTAAERLSVEVDQLEKSFREALEAGTQADASTLLDRTIAKQREVLRLDPGVSAEQTARLTELESARGALRARVAAAQSVTLEREAVSAQQAGRTAGTVEQLREALRLQREANANAASADAQDIPREARLAQAIERAGAQPLRAALETALTLARSAVAQEQWDDALKNFSEARSVQAEINSRFPATPGADLAGLDRIDAEIANLQASGLAANMGARERDAETAAGAGRVQEAAAFYAAAAEAQRQLNEKFGRSRFSSATHAEELLVKRDTVLSTAQVARAVALDREATAALARRQTVSASEKIATALALVEEARASYPRSHAVDAVLLVKLTYLGSHRTELDGLQADFYSQLAPVPGAEKFRMFKTEVPQNLFTRVMGNNPSRNAGRTLPVDSVNWTEAQEFCRRSSWLLGWQVRLPTEAEFRAAVGPGGEIWSAENSAGHSHEVGVTKPAGAGFHDVTGNLAEWLQAGETANAPVAGGSYLDAAASLGTLPVVSVEKRERARHVGFRVVVEPAAK